MKNHSLNFVLNQIKFNSKLIVLKFVDLALNAYLSNQSKNKDKSCP